MTVSARKQVLMQLTETLVEELDVWVERTGRNRSDLAREALHDLLRKFRAADIDQQYIAAYTRFPPDDEFDDEERLEKNMAELDAWDGGW